VIKPSQFRKFKPCRETAFPFWNLNPYPFIFKRRKLGIMYRSPQNDLFSACDFSVESSELRFIHASTSFLPFSSGGLSDETIHLCKFYFSPACPFWFIYWVCLSLIFPTSSFPYNSFPDLSSSSHVYWYLSNVLKIHLPLFLAFPDSKKNVLT
jgi:hypothetical protein